MKFSIVYITIFVLLAIFFGTNQVIAGGKGKGKGGDGGGGGGGGGKGKGKGHLIHNDHNDHDQGMFI